MHPLRGGIQLIFVVTMNPGAFSLLLLQLKLKDHSGQTMCQSIINPLQNMQEVPVVFIGGITDGPNLFSYLSEEVIRADFGRVT